MYAHLPKPCAGHRSVLQVVISAIFQDPKGFVDDGIEQIPEPTEPRDPKDPGFFVICAKGNEGPDRTQNMVERADRIHERSGGNGSGKTPGQGVVPVYPADMLDIPELVPQSQFWDICQLSKCGHCGGLKNR